MGDQMPEVVVGRCHGGWGPDEGWVQVPKGTTVYLFLDSYRAMHADDADRSTLMSPDELQAMQGKASQTISEFRTVCNYGIQALSENDVVHEGPMQQGVELVNEDGLHLADIMQQHKGSNIYWFACQALDGLNPVVDGVDLNKLDLEQLSQSDLDDLEQLDLDNEAGLSDEQKAKLEKLQELASKMGLSDLKELKARKALLNKIQRFS
jgi:hypothetical protein